MFFGLLFFISISFLNSQYKQKPRKIVFHNQSVGTSKTSLVHAEQQITISLKTSSMRCIVCVRTRLGRLGNRMFTIASAYALARLHSCHLFFLISTLEEIREVFIFHLEPFLLPTFIFNRSWRNVSHPMKKISRDIACQYVPELTHPNTIPSKHIFELQGFWQSYLNFDKYRDELRNRVFVARPSVLERVSKLFIDIYEEKFHVIPQFSSDNHQLFKNQLAQLNWTIWIGIHVRRADFVSLQFASSDEYLFAAIEYYTERYSNAHFIVASDDKRYCRKLFRNRANIFLAPRSFDEGDDLIALSLCQHSIITGGTFGWWAGYLASGEVIHDTASQAGCEQREYYYPPWFKTIENARKYKINS
ncbi:unnamed protein product [Rotaria socialis]|uniref:L-Fucosyltransferase n=1 Tax=Rotaria socialis TaxID=392032 RepID=A0A817NM70_9BILA|nr:unnamed protein product [Rotaria socialis]CAF3522704.1 unnamed protein product [Rotaria socialis]CAF3690934.1 unnamed protein product [Rotaria socialis]CAF4168950.1 unnamed protein product [Rotaria socialis]CAF4342249.1 unnamed protein product [Rotaria socialis]